jgi:hypothetical protein
MFKEVLAACVSQEDVLKLRSLKRKTDSLIEIEFLPKEYSEVVDSWTSVYGGMLDVEASIAKLKPHMEDKFVGGEIKKMISHLHETKKNPKALLALFSLFPKNEAVKLVPRPPREHLPVRAMSVPL